ncbi:adenosine kinase [Geoalkalibacter ferrihydriticus]|uniref:Sugar kinase n=2 Tax=Geoalkalibacter ferrihydriticus TaxID=392333 RepID=A0A0C2HJW3_9BACT|nr:carbohydrate kinase family protein [Geoalkalibacter ferrihydriticus]KIH77356.1 sugar kinase [Geoalkalibacter ferrihydriticus DSM 17813]SDM18530.1 adenosine kinase [Geoalkalibacter ferrihydriticus]
MQALICGSFAYDNIMVFGDRFKNHILPDQVHILNVSFLVPEMRKEFGGCAGNIAYNLQLLGGSPLPMGTVGEDFAPYAEWMDACGIEQRHVIRIENSFTAQAFITTDLDDNQITAFHPGAMAFAHHNKVSDAQGVSLGIVSPDGREGMIEHAAQFVAAGIPFIFDPGQGLPMFDGDDLRRFIDQATWLTVNDYEWQLIRERTGLSAAEVAGRLEALIVTRGGQGSTIYTTGGEICIPAAHAAQLKDPTGCGDAYRAGLLYGLMNKLDWETTGRIASLMGAIKIEHQGTQNHRFDMTEFSNRYREAFDREL